jgi:PhnB protein
MQVIPYINFDGHCAEAFSFYSHIFGGELVLMTYGDSPMADDLPKAAREQIIHARIVTSEFTLMGADSMPGNHRDPQGIQLNINVDSPEQADRIFTALQKGGKIIMPLEQTFWASRFGMLVDRFGIPWMVNCEAPR